MTTELITQNGHAEFTLQAYSQHLEQNLKFCQILLKTQMCPKNYTSPEQVLIAILYGQEIGFSPLQSLQSIDVIDGKPALQAIGIKSLILSKGGRFKTIEWTDKVCTLTCSRGSDIEEFTFTMADAETMRISKKDNWVRMPKHMLYARCCTTLARNLWSDILKGLPYCKEELEDSTPETKTFIEHNSASFNGVPVKPKEPETFVYNFDKLTDDQRAFLHDVKAYKDPNSENWISRIDLGRKLAKYRVQDTEEKKEVAVA